MNPARSSVAIVVRGGRRAVLGSEKDIPSIPLSVRRSKEVCSSAFRDYKTARGEGKGGMETLGLGGVEGLISTDGKRGGKM